MNYLAYLFSSGSKIFSYDVADNWNAAQEQIEEVGFAVVKLFDDNEVSSIEHESIDLLNKIKDKNVVNEFLAVGRLGSAELRIQSTQLIEKLVVPNLSGFIATDFEIISGIHLLKPSGKKGVLNPHQDSSLVDESIYRSYFFWMPVTNIEENDGTLEVIPYSHLLEIPFRSLNIPWPLAPFEKELWKYTKKVIVPVGHAIIFHSRLIHASGQNNNQKLRIAVNSFIKPVKAAFLHYYSDESSNFNTIESFVVHPKFFYEEDIMKKPGSKYKHYKTETNINKKYTLKELESVFKQ